MAQEIDDKKDAPFEQSHDSERTIAISAANGGSECADAFFSSSSWAKQRPA